MSSLNVLRRVVYRFLYRHKSTLVATMPEDTVVNEGKAKIFQPSSVFYNPVQEFNRDLTIAVISEFRKDHIDFIQKKRTKQREKQKCEVGEDDNDENVQDSVGSVDDNVNLETGKVYPDGMRILEGLAASGLRSIRFAKEIPGVKEIIANDYDTSAVEYIQRNIDHNDLAQLVRGNYGDAAMFMYQHRKKAERFDVIDLDPYGSPAQFLDAAVQSVRDGGLLCVTCTDLGVLSGNSAETCSAKYGSFPIRAKYCHESALRILLRSIDSHANRYSRYIQPVLSLSADFYIRVFVKVYTGQKIVKESVTKLSSIYLCGGCKAFHLQPLATKTPTEGNNYKFTAAHAPTVKERCEECNSHHRIAGPIWTAPIHDVDFLTRVIQSVRDDGERFGTQKRIIGMLTVMTEELPDAPLYYDQDELVKIVHCTTPKFGVFRSAVLHAGYRVSGSHAFRRALKTDAPQHVIYDIIRGWAKLNPPNPQRIKDNKIATAILNKTPAFEANFELHPEANPKSRADGLVRFQANPERNWGPQPRAKEGGAESLEERCLKGVQKAQLKRDAKRKQQDPIDLKKHPCKRFKVGECDLGDDCAYSHDVQPDEKV